MTSATGNPDVDYQLIRWIDDPAVQAGSIYDVAPYHQVAVVLRIDDAPIWFDWYRLGMAWFDRPYLASNADHGEFLIVPGRYTGTGAFVDDTVFVGNGIDGWRRVAGSQLDQETGDGWLGDVAAVLPEDHYIAKGVSVDYTTLTGASEVWHVNDPNCCPSGGRVAFRLTLRDPARGFEIAEADYRP